MSDIQSNTDAGSKEQQTLALSGSWKWSDFGCAAPEKGPL